jgi:hypothetical protein
MCTFTSPPEISWNFEHTEVPYMWLSPLRKRSLNELTGVHDPPWVLRPEEVVLHFVRLEPGRHPIRLVPGRDKYMPRLSVQVGSVGYRGMTLTWSRSSFRSTVK